MSFAEIDSVYLDAGLIRRLRANDPLATKEARKICDGLVTYMHALSTMPDEEEITVRELNELGIVESITLHTEVV